MKMNQDIRINYQDWIEGVHHTIPETYLRPWRDEGTWEKMVRAMRAAGIEEEAIKGATKRRNKLLTKNTTWIDLHTWGNW